MRGSGRTPQALTRSPLAQRPPSPAMRERVVPLINAPRRCRRTRSRRRPARSRSAGATGALKPCGRPSSSTTTPSSARRPSMTDSVNRPVSPSLPPSRSSRNSAIGSSTRLWIARFSGLAPKAGSQPSSASRRRAASSAASARPRSARRSLTRASWISTIRAISLASQPAEDQHVVEPVQEFRPEGAPHRIHDLPARLRDRLVLAEREQCLGAEIRGHDQDRVPEIGGAALAVGQPAVLERLQQHVEHVGMRLLDLVEQHDLIRLAPDLLGQRAAVVIADIARRRADHARDRVPLHVLRHIEPGDRVLVVEQELGQRLGQFGLADAGRSRGTGTSRSAGSGP